MLTANGGLGRRERRHHRDVSHLHALSGHEAVLGDGGPGSNDDQQLGSLRHASRRLSTERHHPRSAEGRVRLGVSRLLRMGIGHQGRIRASIAQAFAQAFCLQHGMEEVRAGVGRRHPSQATVTNAADARGGLVASQTGPNARNDRGLSTRIDFSVASGIPAFSSIGANTVTA